MENENVINEENTKKTGVGRIVTSIVLLILCAILVLGTIVCSFIKKDFNPGVNDPDYIVVYTKDSSSSANQSMFAKDTDEYNEIMDLYKSSFVAGFYNALFQGIAFSGVTEKDDYKSFSTLTGPYLEFKYNTTQKMYVNGQSYDDYVKARQAAGGQGGIVSNSDYISLIVEVFDTDSYGQINIYFRYRDTGVQNYSYIRLISYAKQSALYDYIENMK